jgi:flagellar protein FlaG
MDPGLVKAGPPAQALQTPPRPEPAAGAATARTELPAPRVVTAPEATLAPRADAGSGPEPARAREFTFDAAARQMIFRIIDVDNGTVVSQLPDESMLKLRAYREQQEKAATERALKDRLPAVERIA